MKKTTLSTILILMASLLAYAQKEPQKGIIYLKGNQQIPFVTIREAPNQYHFTYFDAENEEMKSSILVRLVDSVRFTNAMLFQGYLPR